MKSLKFNIKRVFVVLRKLKIVQIRLDFQKKGKEKRGTNRLRI